MLSNMLPLKLAQVWESSAEDVDLQKETEMEQLLVDTFYTFLRHCICHHLWRGYYLIILANKGEFRTGPPPRKSDEF